MTGRMNIQMSLTGKHGPLSIILNLPADGQDLGRKVRVERIVYTPRNRDNYVRPGDVYELFYCDNDWKSAGKIKATADSLVFRDIPANALLLLRNHTRGLDERIFIYENKTQLWK